MYKTRGASDLSGVVEQANDERYTAARCARTSQISRAGAMRCTVWARGSKVWWRRCFEDSGGQGEDPLRVVLLSQLSDDKLQICRDLATCDPDGNYQVVRRCRPTDHSALGRSRCTRDPLGAQRASHLKPHARGGRGSRRYYYKLRPSDCATPQPQRLSESGPPGNGKTRCATDWPVP